MNKLNCTSPRFFTYCTIFAQALAIRGGGYRAWAIDHRLHGTMAESSRCFEAPAAPPGFCNGERRDTLAAARADADRFAAELTAGSAVGDRRASADTADSYAVSICLRDDPGLDAQIFRAIQAEG